MKSYKYSEPLSDFFEIFLRGDTGFGSYFEFERRYADELKCGAANQSKIDAVKSDNRAIDVVSGATKSDLGDSNNLDAKLDDKIDHDHDHVYHTTFEDLKSAPFQVK